VAAEVALAQDDSAGSAGASAPPALLFRNLSKAFGGQRALDNVSLRVERGEVHGLLGQNGSGKSTLIKVLAGFHEPDPGSELAVDGREVPLPLAPGRFRELGISFVHQNLGLIPALTVVENLLIGRLAASAHWRLDWRRERAEATGLFQRYGIDLDPGVEVAKLSPVQRALLAIVRAMNELDRADRGGLLVLDEPTPFLPRRDIDQLFAVIRRVVAHGASVIFVSHDVDEVLEITDRATVLRDGRVAGTLVTREAAKDQFIEMIVGRRLEVLAPAAAAIEARPVRARVTDLEGEVVHGLWLDLHEGEILGATGLIGAGYDEVPYLLYGARPAVGVLEIDGRRLDLRELTPARAIAEGIVLIPADRAGAGAIATLPVTDNVTMPVLGRAFRPWRLDRAAMVARARELGRAFEVVPDNPALPLSGLSGGNQQKVLLAKWLQLDPKLILLDEPTQGVDVGARQRVFGQILRAAADGAAVLCASSDYEQLATLCQRILIFAQGKVTGELSGGTITKDAIAERCYAGLGARSNGGGMPGR
jgi:ribose transport system ATP-binding protein